MRYSIVTIFLILFNLLNHAACLSPRYSAIVIEAASGRVLEQEGADRICHPASLVKMMTLYMVFEALKSGQLTMNMRIPVSAHAARQIPTKLGLRAGEYVSVETIIKGLVTKSANDAAAAIAEYLGGSEANFASMMTRKARRLGMQTTIFKNASGVPNPNQITTARDMAVLSRALYLHFPKDYKHFRLQAFHHRGRVHRNHNHLLGKIPGVDGIKTGYVAASGFNLAASAVRMGPNNKPNRLIAVVLGGSSRHWRDRRVADLLEMNFRKIGFGRNPSHKGEELEEDNDDSEVNEFLKKDLRSVDIERKSSMQPIQINWTIPSRSKSERPHDVGRWGVQIGTYKSLNEARKKAERILSVLHTGEISLPRVSKGKKSFYGARLLKLSKEDAENVCKKQSAQGKECRVLAAH